MYFNCFYKHSSFAGASGACPAPGGGKAPAKFLDPAPGGAFAPAKSFDPAPGGARPRRGEAPPGAGPCRGLPRTPEFLDKNTLEITSTTGPISVLKLSVF